MQIYNYKYLSGCRSVIIVVFMRIKARSVFDLYRFCLHVALRKRYIWNCNGMMRHCREIGLWIFVIDRSQCRVVDVRRSIRRRYFV